MQWREHSVFVGQNLLLEVSEYAQKFYGFTLIFRNKDAVYLEDSEIEKIIFSTLKCVCITFSKYLGINEVRHLSHNFFRRLSPPSGQYAIPPPTC